MWVATHHWVILTAMHPWPQMSNVDMKANSIRQSCFLGLSGLAERFAQRLHV